MASLTNKKIKDTYGGLLKTSDNAAIDGVVEITDGLGNSTGVSISNNGSLTATGQVTADSFVGDGSGLTNISGAVSSVNTQTGAVVLDTDDISEGASNLYYTEARVSANTDVVANTAKNSYPTADATKLAGIEAGAEVNPTSTDELSEGSTNLYYTDARVSANSDVVANTAKNSYPTADATKLAGIEAGAEVNPTASEIKTAYESNSDTNAFTDAEKTKLSGIESGAEVNDVTSVNTQTGAVVLDADDIDDTATTNKFTTASDISKLSGIEAGADVTDATNVAAAGALMSGTAVISDLNDVASTTPTDGQVLTYDTTNGWQPETPSGGGGAVDSVNGQTGIVVLDADDIDDSTTINKFTTAADISKLAGIEAGAEVNDVDSVNGQTGVVSLDTADLTDVDTTAPTDGQVLRYVSASSKYVPTTLSSTAPVDSVNGQTGAVVLDADDISDAATTNKWATAAEKTKLGHISVTQAVDLDTMESDIATNSAKNSYPSADATKVGFISVTQAVDLDTMESDIATNNAKVSNVTTNLSTSTTTTSVTVNSSDGTDALINAASGTAAGVMTTADKNKLDGIAAGAEVNVNADWNAVSGDAQILNKPTIPTATSDLTNDSGFITASSTDTLTNKSGSNNQWTNDAGYLTGNETITLSGDITGSGTTAITASIASNAVGADELNVSGNGTSGQVLSSDGDGSFSWVAQGGTYTPSAISTATTAVKDYLYILTASLTLTLPASPSAGDSIKIANLSGVATCVIGRNGSNIMATAEDMTLDDNTANFELIYTNATQGWVVIGAN